MKNTRSGLLARAKAARASSPHAGVTVVRAASDTDAGDDSPSTRSAELWLYGTVGGYWWGFDSDTVAAELRALGEVDEITVRLHSFGGNAVEGIAIANLLANNPARIRVVVDGMAASAASMIVLAGDELIMSPGSQFMVHDPWMCTCGNAAELRLEADYLDKQATNYAETYAHRAGGTAEEWRARMTADPDGTWYTAAEAVEAGLADRVDNITTASPPPPLPALGDVDELDGDMAAAAACDLDLLHPAARAAWATWRSSAPKPPAASAPGIHNNRTEQETAMAFTPEQLTQMRQDLGLAETADEATIVAALSEALAEQADAPAAPTSAQAVPEGYSLIETETLNSIRAGATAGQTALAAQREAHRNSTIDAAIASGRFAPSRREHYEASWAADPQGTEELIASLEPGLVPVSEIGHDQPPADDTNANIDADDFLASLGLTKEDIR